MRTIERYIITGDIHGCSEEFESLLEKVNLNTETDRLILLGDLFDRGPNSYEVYCKYKELKEAMGDRLTLIMGNHEDMLIGSLYDMYLWRINGCDSTIQSFSEHKMSYNDIIPEIEKLPLYYKADKFTCVHAGVDDLGDIPIEEQDKEILTWDRICARNGYYNGPLVIAGHTPVRHPILWRDRNVEVLEYGKKYDLPDHGFMCIDTACVYGGSLTGLVIMDDKMILRSVPSLRENVIDD